MATLPQPRECLINFIDVASDLFEPFAIDGADFQIFFHSKIGKQAAPLGNKSNSQSNPLVGWKPGNIASIDVNATLGGTQA
jgi:hypothetical protein